MFKRPCCLAINRMKGFTGKCTTNRHYDPMKGKEANELFNP